MSVTSVAMAHAGKVDAEGCHKNSQTGKHHCHAQGKPTRSKRGFDFTKPPRVGDEGVFDGPVVWVADGDTVRVLVKGRVMDVRLTDIDAPESDQPYGWRAKLELIDLVRDRQVLLVPFDIDKYGRVVARLWVGSVDVNLELVKRGAAWFYPEYAKDESLFRVEQGARNAKRGLWALPADERVEPRLWRKSH